MSIPRVSCSTRIYIKDQPFLSIGRIMLLENIAALGSITKAAAAMNMSYRKAWLLVQNMNDMAKKPLVIKQSGGKKGGGAMLTPEGKEAIDTYHLLQKDIQDFLKVKNDEINFSY